MWYGRGRLGVALVCHCLRSSPHFESKDLLPVCFAPTQEDMTKENKKLKVCLEELQAKLRQVMEKSSCASKMKSYEAIF